MHLEDDCIFCKIIKGEIPSLKIYEDENAVAFMDIAPFEKGHVLVVPKHHAPQLSDLPEDVLTNLAKTVQKVAADVQRKLPSDGYNIMQNNGKCAGQTVFHVHVHIIPRYEGGQFHWKAGSYASDAERDEIYRRLTAQ